MGGAPSLIDDRAGVLVDLAAIVVDGEEATAWHLATDRVRDFIAAVLVHLSVLTLR